MARWASRAQILPVAPSADGAVPDAYRPEIQELSRLSQQLAGYAPRWNASFAEELLSAPESDPIELEKRLEEVARAIRQAWLTAAATKTSQSFRSPNECDMPTTPRGNRHAFGYEREICPTALERRCATFFEAPPAGHVCEHVLFSSGQAAMLACLLVCGASGEVAHLGSYFETAELLALVQSGHARQAHQARPIVVAEPVWFDGIRWGTTEVAAIRERSPDAVIVDATLSGLRYEIGPLLSALPQTQTLRVHSALKLFQHGLELTDGGIVTVFHRDADAVQSTAAALRRVRSLCGLGLRFAEIAVLELPAFLNRPMTVAYENKVFAHNAALAGALAKTNRLFAEDIHPSLTAHGAAAPYCTLRLRNPSDSAYAMLEDRMRDGATRSGILLDRGGSFGFRGHRYELVRPENGPAFLRVAMGRRCGASLKGCIDLFQNIAAGTAADAR